MWYSIEKDKKGGIKMKLIHCGDIHLDSRMESNLSGEKARERNVEICATFTRMIRYGQDHGVKAVCSFSVLC